jgi:outer membrane protein assembly factor BamB
VAAVNPYAPRVQYVFALSADGKFHSLYVSNGDEPKPGIPFLPAKANAQGLIVFENHAYVATVNGCGGVENGIWALDLESRKVSRWKSGQPLAGSASPAAAPDGTLYAATARELVALTEGTLALKGTFKLHGGEFASSPVVFDFKDKDLVAALGTDGRLHIIDAADLSRELAASGAADAQKPATGKAAPPVSLASWQDPASVRWVLAPSAGAIVAWKVVERDGKVAVERGWTSGSMVAPFTPIIVNGVVFALSSGSASSRAILYALDPTTGKELWNSGEVMSTFVRTTGGLAAGGSHIYVATQDGTQYAFGFPIEH